MDFTPGKPVRLYDKSGQWRDMSTDELVGLQLNKFRGWKCGAGVDNLQVDMDGNVFGASCAVGGRLGNVYEDFTLPPAWVNCIREVCSCGADMFVPKAKSYESRQLLRRTHGESTQVEKRSPDLVEFAATERTHFSAFKQVYWEIGRRCNFDCSYCAPYIHNNTDRHKSLDELKTATTLVLQKFAPNSLVNFIISGGEPTLNPAFLDWARWIAAQGHHLSMHSNGSRLADYYRELIRYGDLNFSVHFEFVRMEKMLANIRAVTEEKVSRNNQGVGHLEVKIMMPPGKRQATLDLERQLRDIPEFTNFCTWAIVPIRDGNNMEDLMVGYEPEDFQLFGDRK